MTQWALRSRCLPELPTGHKQHKPSKWINTDERERWEAGEQLCIHRYVKQERRQENRLRKKNRKTKR